MQYNATIKNTEALPIAYIIVDPVAGSSVHQMHSKKELFVNIVQMSVTSLGQLNIRIVQDEKKFSDLVFQTAPGLCIVPTQLGKP